MASSSRHHRTREDYLKNKEAEEARKAGTLPPQTDEEGRDINPHIPEYVKQAPWYLDSTQPSLKHQKSIAFDQSKKQATAKFGQFAPRGAAGPAATKYRKGACTNCGSMTHDAKSCVERPRKLGAKHTGKDIKADEIVSHLETDYAAKHDPYARYDPAAYSDVVEKFDRLEKHRREVRAEEEAKRILEAKAKGEAAAAAALAAGGGTEGGTSGTGGDDEFRVEDGQDNFGQFAKTDTKSARSVRDLRIREDTAKYLIDRSEDAPFYDPKSHSMRANPRPDGEEEGDAQGFQGDNFNRFTGDTKTFYDMQRFAWEAAETTQNATVTHVEASPSLAAAQFEQRQAELRAEREKFQRDILATYGGAEHLEAPPPELTTATEVYTEYRSDGMRVGASVSSTPKSKYLEDVFPGNHKSVWGSYYTKGKWGYKCCHQTSKNAYCTGTPVVTAPPPASSSTSTTAQDSSAPQSGSSRHNDSDRASTSVSNSKEFQESDCKPKDSKHRRRSDSSLSDSSSSSSSSSSSEGRRKKRKRSSKSKRRSRRSSSSESSSDSEHSDGRPSKKKVLKYLEEERKARESTEMDERKRAYNSKTLDEKGGQVPSAARMEAYHMAQERWDDPMKRMQGDKDDLQEM